MIRNTALLLLACALALTGCKKNASNAAKDQPAAGKPAAVAESNAAAGKAAAAEPSAPNFTQAAPTPKQPPKPAIDNNASVIALCYHNIEDSAKTRALTIPVSQFEQEMQGLKDGGFSVISMQDFLAWRRGEKNIPSKSCIITIDDGWASGYTNAWPILKKHGYPFTMFIYVNYVGSGGKSLSWAQLGEMRDAGVDIQSHTYSHSNLRAPGTGVDAHTAALVKKDIAALGKDGWLKKEIFDSKKVLEQNLGIKVNCIAYPFGIYSDAVKQLVKEAGYEAAFTVYGQRLSRQSPYDALGRYALEAGKPKIFTDALAMIGGGSGLPSESMPNTVAQLAAASMVTQPLNGETITNVSPTIKANLSTMGDIDPASLEVRLSGVGALNAQLDPATKMMTAPVTQKLKPDTYTVIIAAMSDGVRKETRWSFTVGQSAGSLLSATPAPMKAAPASKPDLDAATPAKGHSAAATPKKKK